MMVYMFDICGYYYDQVSTGKEMLSCRNGLISTCFEYNFPACYSGDSAEMCWVMLSYLNTRTAGGDSYIVKFHPPARLFGITLSKVLGCGGFLGLLMLTDCSLSFYVMSLPISNIYPETLRLLTGSTILLFIYLDSWLQVRADVVYFIWLFFSPISTVLFFCVLFTFLFKSSIVMITVVFEFSPFLWSIFIYSKEPTFLFAWDYHFAYNSSTQAISIFIRLFFLAILFPSTCFLFCLFIDFCFQLWRSLPSSCICETLTLNMIQLYAWFEMAIYTLNLVLMFRFRLFL